MWKNEKITQATTQFINTSTLSLTVMNDGAERGVKVAQELMTELRRGPAAGARPGGGVAQSELWPHRKDYLGV